MKSNRNETYVLPLVTAVALAIPMRAEIIEQVLVKVNGDIITKTDLETRQIAALRERVEQPGRCRSPEERRRR